MEPWYKIATPRKEVREGRSFNPDEFAIALEQVVAKTAPEDYSDAKKFLSRTYPTKALRQHVGMVLRRLAGKTEGTAPVLTLVTQFGGGKTHTLTTLYHLAQTGKRAKEYSGVADILKEAGISEVPKARVAVFVGNAWDPGEGRETPWIDIARQLAGDKGVALLGKTSKTTPPGTEALGRVFEAAGDSVLILCDEVLNFINRHRGMADGFHAFIQNLTVAMTGIRNGAAVISLPRSQVEMTEWDLAWQEKITKVVRRVAKDLTANDEAEISEVVRRRLFEDLGPEKTRREAAKAYAEWCFDRRNQLPPEWTAVDSATTEAKAREFLRGRFEACFPFHPATLSVFQRKWQALPQYQQTRGTLAMLAQWVSWVYREGYQSAWREPFIKLGSAPLASAEFRSAVLGQLGEPRLETAIGVDLAGPQAHASVLDADTKGVLQGIHRRVGTAILFESSGGHVDRVAHLPELRFALLEPGIDTTSIDSAASALEAKAFFISRVGTDGYKIYHKATLRKAVSDRKASLDDDEVRDAAQALVREEFKQGAAVPVQPFPQDGAAVPDSPRLTLVVVDPGVEWTPATRSQIAEWTLRRGQSPRLYPGALMWCVRKPGRELRDKVEVWLAWKRVAKEVAEGTLGSDFDRVDRAEVEARAREAESAAKDEVWATYRFVALAESGEPDGLKVLDLGAGHSSGRESLSARVISALKNEGLLNETVSAGYLERKWPAALKQSGAWPLSGLRQCFLNGTLPRLLDPDGTLTGKIAEFVGLGEFGLASGSGGAGGFARLWFKEPLNPDEISFESDVFLLTKQRAEQLAAGVVVTQPSAAEAIGAGPNSGSEKIAPEESGETIVAPVATKSAVRIRGQIPPEVWNRLGTKLLPRLKQGTELKVSVQFEVQIDGKAAGPLREEVSQVISDLGLNGSLRIEP